jgi:hypothetical protein
MLRIVTLLVFTLFLHAATQAQAVRRYHQQLELSDASAVRVDAQAAEVEMKEWAGSEILVEVFVTTKSGSTTILNHLQQEGRYDLIVTVESGVAVVKNKMLKRQTIKVKGAEMDEQIWYVISVPENINVTNTSAAPSESKSRK